MTPQEALNASREDLEKLSTEELEKLLDEVNDLADEYYTKQITNKTLINSLYGTIGNTGFVLFNEKIAQAITGNGRYFIRLVSKNIDEKLSVKLGEHYEFISYNDTDSFFSSTIVDSFSIKNMTIEKLYETVKGEEKEIKPQSFVKKTQEDVKVLSLNPETKKIEEKSISYLMKHKVKKELYKVTVDGRSVIITGDHSIMIERNGKIIKSKVAEIEKGDKIILNKI